MSMTESQIAQKIFQRPQLSTSMMSLIVGTALTSVTDGQAEVDLSGFTATEEGSLLLPSLSAGIAIGDSVAVALYGPEGGPKKALILGSIGAAGGGSIEELEARMRAAEADIDDLQATVSAQGATISGLSSTVSGHTTSISNLQSRMTNAEGDIDALETLTSSQGSAISSLQSTVSGHTTSISNLQSRMTNAEGDIDALESSQSTQDTEISDLDDRVTALEQGGSLPALEQRVTTLEGKMTTAEGDIDSLESSVSSLSSTVSGHTTSISDLLSRMTSAESRLTALEGQWGLHQIATLSEGSQITGKGVYEFNAIGGTLLSKWPSGQNVGDFAGVCFDYAADGYATLIVTSPRSNTIFLLKKWAGNFDYVRAV